MELVSFWKLNLPKHEEIIDESSEYLSKNTVEKYHHEQWPKTRM
jgi:hypothetical protein